MHDVYKAMAINPDYAIAHNNIVNNYSIDLEVAFLCDYDRCL